MSYYATLVMLTVFLVELLLLVASDKLCGLDTQWISAILVSMVSGVYGGICLLSEFSVLQATICRYVLLVLLVLLYGGISIYTVSRGAVFLLLNMVVEGVVADFQIRQIWFPAFCVIFVILLCRFGVEKQRREVLVEIVHNGISAKVCALRDTGNTLIDPITGDSVLVVGGGVAFKLLGLTREQLRLPLETLVCCNIPGLRIVPYQTISQGRGFLLAVQVQNVTIGNRSGSRLIAFAPEGLGDEDRFQALMGGSI